MSVYYNKKLISGVRDVPQMTLAEYNALTNKPDLWLRTDAPESDRGITASDIQYDENTTVYQKLGWSLIGTLTGQSGNSINLSGYTEYVFVPKVNGVFRYNSYHTLKMAIWYGSTGIFHMSCYENSSTGWHGHVDIASDGTATLTNDLLNSWSSMTVDVYGKP